MAALTPCIELGTINEESKTLRIIIIIILVTLVVIIIIIIIMIIIQKSLSVN